MANKAIFYTCALCGEQVTCPYFHNGKVYGYTCITKVGGKAKKEKGKFLPAITTYVQDTETCLWWMHATGSINGVSFALKVCSLTGYKEDAERILPNGVVKIHDGKSMRFKALKIDFNGNLTYKGQVICKWDEI